MNVQTLTNVIFRTGCKKPNIMTKKLCLDYLSPFSLILILYLFRFRGHGGGTYFL